jgi:UPF0042 nucleotide-binding protein
MKLIVISGVSGSGKSTALNVLEDLGYYCIDNMPVGLLPALAEQMLSVPGELVENITVGVDARSLPGELRRFSYILEQLKNKGVICETLFLDADDNILLTRFSETRRKHPLSLDALPLMDAIQTERKLLEPIASKADLYIDTTRTNLHQLRDLIRERIESKTEQTLSLLVQSFGFKHGVPADADFVFDARCLPNPHWEPSLRPQTGLHEGVISFLQQHQQVENMFNDILNFMQNWIPAFIAENRSYMTIAIGCTGGQHRSVYLTNRLANEFRKLYNNVSERHRDMS